MYEYFDYDIENASFEWDDEKDHLNFTKHDQLNFTKHGIRFRTAAKVFLDPYKLIREDEEHQKEERYNILGKVGKVLFVVCAFRKDHVVRLISARMASAPERERYYNGEGEL